jgi:tRNA dimethylallyltransferase
MSKVDVEDTETAAGYFLVGPTASGKTNIAQHLAELHNRSILSADSMLVYKGMDIGTAKPTPRQRGQIPYFGIDVVHPTETFSTGTYLEHARSAVSGTKRAKSELTVAGGTGLYIRALLEGLPGSAAPSDEVREQVQAIFAEGGLDGLRKALQEREPVRLAAIDDPQNPRRLQRALELSLADLPLPTGRPSMIHPPIPGLRYPRETLITRIHQRVRRMFDDGLVDEVRALRAQYGDLSATAAGGIGYEEAAAILDDQLSIPEAVEKTAARTRQLAKRQMTWFSNQIEVNWIDVAENESPESIADRVEQVWRKAGATPMNGI